MGSPRHPVLEGPYRRALGITRNAYAALGVVAALAAVVGAALLALFGWLALEVSEHWLDPVDTRYMLALHAEANPGLTRVMKALSLVGAGAVAIPAGLAVFAALWWWRGRRRAALLYLCAVLSGWALNGLAKSFFRRARPDVIPRLDAAGWYSFPSGHAMLAPLVFGLGSMLLLAEVRSPMARLLGVALAGALVLGIAVSRVYLGVHYPSDVVAALAAGTGWGALWVAGSCRLRPADG